MTQTSHDSSSHPSALTTVELTLKDGLRTLGVNLQLGAHWLVHDVGPRVAQQMGPLGTSGKMEKLHVLVDSAAKGTLSKLEAAQHRAAATAMADEPYRNLDFQLLPLEHYFLAGDKRNPSGLFTEVFYWLIRHALAVKSGPDSRWIVRQLTVDAVFWQVQDHFGARLPSRAAGDADAQRREQQHAVLCAQLLLALLSHQPVQDATVPPWVHQQPMSPDTPELLTLLLGVVLAAGSVSPTHTQTSDATSILQLGQQLALARLPGFAAALQHASPVDALATEFSFVFRHL
ncbi:MAG: hypothetical protein ABI434_10735 [Burkholderiaceae bacterium]